MKTMKNKFQEIIITICLVLVTILLLNPFHFWMPNMMVMIVLALTLVLFGIFASFILREKIFDERDAVHSSLAGRNAFLVGSATLTLAIIIEEWNGRLDPWLVIVFIIMLLTKIVTRIWTDKNL